ncbi:MAG: putative RNA methyltransferase [Planctomycetota bacterium]
MFPLRCPVRNCCLPLAVEGSTLRCERGHSFDRAREGYYSLAQPQDRKSKTPGDSDAAVLARRRWLERGHMNSMAELIAEKLNAKFQNARPVLELGCGEGSLSKQIFAGHGQSDPAAGFCGVDLSKRAIRLSARHWNEASWILANADRTLPIPDDSIGLVVSLFGRRPLSEIRRVLRAEGIALFAVPGECDLIELREHVQSKGEKRDRVTSIVEDCERSRLVLIDRMTWQERCHLNRDAISDVLSMSYRAFRRSERERLAELEQADVTLHAEILIVQKEV